MKLKILSIILMLAAVNGLAQSPKSAFSDTLVKNKEIILAKYIPIANGEYLFSGYQIPLDSFIYRINAFKAAFNVQINEEKNTMLKDLKKKDVEFYSYNVLAHYRTYYGMDSVGMGNVLKLLDSKQTGPNFDKSIDSAQKLAFHKRLSKEEKSRIEDIVNNASFNDAALFKTSSAYRQWVNDHLKSLQRKKYPTDSALGYGGGNVGILKAISAEVSDAFIKEYLLYTFTETVLKSVNDVSAKETAYKDFIKVVTNSTYKSHIQEIYANYKNMASNAQAPNFTYTNVDGKMVSLKSLRGKYVYIDVWATWCVPCKAEIPFLAKIEEEYKNKNIHFVSLSVDRIADKSKWQAYVRNNKLQGIQLMADKDFNSEFVNKFNINSIPRFILIDPKGNIVSGDAKRPSDTSLRKQFDTLL